MGKQAKKKAVVGGATQKTHNRATRGVNTRKRGALWAIRQRKVKDKDGNESYKEERVYVPPRTLFDPWDKNRNDPRKAQEPFDDLSLDWREELMHYAGEREAKIGSVSLGDGMFSHRVFYGKNAAEPTQLLLEVFSSKQLTLEKPPRRR
jgi:hypothetical protein